VPYSIRKRGSAYEVVNTETGEVKAAQSAYEVVNTETGEVKAAHTSRQNAKRQVRLLNAVKHGFKPTGRPARS
jgi:curli biogenesis system outer membrane secretion channel CsgG